MAMSFRGWAKNYLSGLLVYTSGMALFNFLPYYQSGLSWQTQWTLMYLYLSYVILSPLYYAFLKNGSGEGKPFLFLRAVKKYFSTVFWPGKHSEISREEKVATLFMAVKLFYLPMINFFWNNLGIARPFYENFQWYPFALNFLFVVDTLIFAFGYAFEFRFLKNVVKSVEPTIFGWAVTLICYPPFNMFAGKYVPWGANDYADFGNVTIYARIILVLLLAIFVAASISLGFKASNLTNRGIVSKFPYSVVRHPAYVSKILIWWITLVPVMSIPFALGMCFWTIIYFFRAMTEERHLMQDPDYVAYCRKVKYRFVPGIF